MTVSVQKKYADKMAEHLPALRKELGISQRVLADKVGLSRSTITKVEGKHQDLAWSNFLAFFFIFKTNPKTAKLLKTLEIDTKELSNFLSGNKKKGGGCNE